MIIYQERNDQGRRVTAEFYSAYCSSKQQPTPIDRVSFLYGMQAFCCEQLKTELHAAVDALEGSVAKSMQPPHGRRAFRGAPANR